MAGWASRPTPPLLIPRASRIAPSTGAAVTTTEPCRRDPLREHLGRRREQGRIAAGADPAAEHHRDSVILQVQPLDQGGRDQADLPPLPLDEAARDAVAIGRDREDLRHVVAPVRGVEPAAVDIGRHLVHAGATRPAQDRVPQGRRLASTVLGAGRAPQGRLGELRTASPVPRAPAQGDEPRDRAVGGDRQPVDPGAAHHDGRRPPSVPARSRANRSFSTVRDRPPHDVRESRSVIDGLLVGQVDRGEVAAGVRDLAGRRPPPPATPRRRTRSTTVDRLLGPEVVLRAPRAAMPRQHVAVQAAHDRDVGLAAPAVDGDDDVPRAPRRHAHGRYSRLRAISASDSRFAASHWPTSGWASRAATTRSRPPWSAACEGQLLVGADVRDQAREQRLQRTHRAGTGARRASRRRWSRSPHRRAGSRGSRRCARSRRARTADDRPSSDDEQGDGRLGVVGAAPLLEQGRLRHQRGIAVQLEQLRLDALHLVRPRALAQELARPPRRARSSSAGSTTGSSAARGSAPAGARGGRPARDRARR